MFHLKLSTCISYIASGDQELSQSYAIVIIFPINKRFIAMQADKHLRYLYLSISISKLLPNFQPAFLSLSLSASPLDLGFIYRHKLWLGGFHTAGWVQILRYRKPYLLPNYFLDVWNGIMLYRMYFSFFCGIVGSFGWFLDNSDCAL